MLITKKESANINKRIQNIHRFENKCRSIMISLVLIKDVQLDNFISRVDLRLYEMVDGSSTIIIIRRG